MDTRSNSFVVVDIVGYGRGLYKVLYDIYHTNGQSTQGWSVTVRAKDEIEAWLKARDMLIQHYKEKELPK